MRFWEGIAGLLKVGEGEQKRNKQKIKWGKKAYSTNSWKAEEEEEKWSVRRGGKNVIMNL